MNSGHILIYSLIGITLGIIEVYLVKKKNINRWILPLIVGIISIVLGLSFSGNLAASLVLNQAIALLGLYIVDKGNHKNNDKEKIKIKDL